MEKKPKNTKENRFWQSFLNFDRTNPSRTERVEAEVLTPECSRKMDP